MPICLNGHSNFESARFCASCGVSINTPPTHASQEQSTSTTVQPSSGAESTGKGSISGDITRLAEWFPRKQKILLSWLGILLLIVAIGMTSSCNDVHAKMQPAASSPDSMQSAANTPPTTNPPAITDPRNQGYAVLKPATIAPVVAECSVSVSSSGGPDISPLKCGAEINVQAWQAYQSIGSNVLSLGSSQVASIDIVTAMCADLNSNHATGSEENQAATLAAIYYGWNGNLVSAINGWDSSAC